MKNAIRLSVVFACTALLAACGGGAKLKAGKDNAAAAAFAASQGAGSAQGGLLDLARQNAGTNLDVTVNCPHGGKATIHYTLDTDHLLDLSFDLQYADCSYNGTTHMSGTMAMLLGVTDGAAGLTMKGRVDFTGDIADFVDVNLTMDLTGSGLHTAEGASVALSLNGSVKTSTESYAYTDETFTVSAGHMEGEAK